MDTVLTIVKQPFRLIRWVAGSILVTAIAIAVMSYILDGFITDGLWGILVAAVAISVVQAVLWPLMFRFFAWLPAIVFPVLIFLALGGIILFSSWLDDQLGLDQFSVNDVETGIWIALGLTVITTVISSLFSLDDRDAYDRFVTGPLRTKYRGAQFGTGSGVLFFEIDGLSLPVLEKAIAGGYAPTMKRWIDDGQHTLTHWEPDLSCQTSASQAGILLGSNENIPAFRWWDKGKQQLMVSSNMKTAKSLEAELASDRGLLEPGGASRFNVFTGGAADSVGTFSNINPGAGSASYWAYFANPYSVARMLSVFMQEVLREWWQEFQQNRKNVLPRVARPWTYALARAGTAVQLEVSHFMCIADIFRGVPSAYYTAFYYDEVAHHTGIDRDYTFKVLRTIDRVLGHLEVVAATAKRPMHLVVLSDHGQSQGATFLQRYGTTLGELVDSLLPESAHITAILDSDEAVGHFEAMMSESISADTRSAKMMKRLVKNRTTDGVVSLGAESDDRTITADEVLVLASGNLGLISFTRWPERMTIKQIIDAFPRLIDGLASHEGIGLILVKDEEEGGIVLGSEGVYFLEADTFDGVNPLLPYGAMAARHLRRTHGFSNCPDLLVISRYWQATEEVAAFEELVGNHGGLGGYQRQPFVLHPAALDAGEEPIVGAAHLNQVMRSWIRTLQGGAIGPDGAESRSRENAEAVSITG